MMEIKGKAQRIGDEWQITIEVPGWMIANLIYDMEENHISPMVYVKEGKPFYPDGGISMYGYEGMPKLFSRVRFEEVGKPKDQEDETE